MPSPLDTTPSSASSLPSSQQRRYHQPLLPYGRFSRVSYVAWMLIGHLIYGAVMLLAMGMATYCIAMQANDPMDFSVLTHSLIGWLALLLMLVSSLIFVYVQICFSIRRLHDLNLSAWWVLIALLPVVGVLFILYLCCAKGQLSNNRFGECRTTEQTEKIIALLASLLLLGYLLCSMVLIRHIPTLLHKYDAPVNRQTAVQDDIDTLPSRQAKFNTHPLPVEPDDIEPIQRPINTANDLPEQIPPTDEQTTITAPATEQKSETTTPMTAPPEDPFNAQPQKNNPPN